MAEAACPSGVHHDGVCCHRCDHGLQVGCSCIDTPQITLGERPPTLLHVSGESALPPVGLTEDGRLLYPCVDCHRVICFVEGIQCTLCALLAGGARG